MIAGRNSRPLASAWIRLPAVAAWLCAFAWTLHWQLGPQPFLSAVRTAAVISLAFSLSGLGVIFGGRPERLTGLLIMLFCVIAAPLPTSNEVMAMQLLLFLILLPMALRTDRIWPLFTQAFLLMAIVTNLAMFWTDVNTFTWLLVLFGWYTMFILAYGVGVAGCMRQRLSARDRLAPGADDG